MNNVHVPVLMDRVLEYLAPSKGGVCCDCTLGEGGHSSEILRKIKPSRLVGLEADRAILEKAQKNLTEFNNTDLIRANFTELKEILANLQIHSVRGILVDLGISMFHYKESGRGFSFDRDEKLDMRIDDRQPLTAWDVINTYSEDRLKKIIWAYGEERWAAMIARNITEARKTRKIETGRDLGGLVASSIPKKFHGHMHPATKVFQAVRIEVNDELNNLEKIVKDAAPLLEKGGRLVIITFHSLEDRIVKHRFQELSTGEVTDETRGTRAEPEFRILAKKPVEADADEVRSNPASRSAKLRVLERRS
jgi:16S rRNA (cytosine1402-N4)-methyltransferase